MLAPAARRPLPTAHLNRTPTPRLLSSFVLQCLHLLPSVLRPRLAQIVLLPPLTESLDCNVEAATQLLLSPARVCDQTKQQQQQRYKSVQQAGGLGDGSGSVSLLHGLGMQLGVQGW